MTRIAYLGPEGTFTEAALSKMSANGHGPRDGRAQSFRPTDSTPAALEVVRAGEADYACVPIENSIEGSVLPTLDSLASGSPLQIFAELTLDVAFTHRGPTGHDGRRCRDGGGVPGGGAPRCGTGLPHICPRRTSCRPTPTPRPHTTSPTGRADAGVSTALAAERYGLTALATDVVDEPNARTRFVLAGPPGPPPPAPAPTVHRWCCDSTTFPARWSSAMTEFAIRDIDLTRIESRPTRTGLGTYIFFLDCVGHVEDDAVAEALGALHDVVQTCAISVHGRRGRRGCAAAPDEASRW